MKYDFFIKNPILQYTAILEHNMGDTRYCTTIEKFELDMKKMFEYGYIPLSLSQYAERLYSDDSIKEDNKYFSVVFLGYPNDYTFIFPVLEKYNVPASIFLSANAIENIDNIKYLSHMTLEDILNYIDSGLVDFYPMWDYTVDKYEYFDSIVQKKIHLFENTLKNSSKMIAFYGCDNRCINNLNSMGIELFLANEYGYNPSDLNKGSIVPVAVAYNEDVVDVITKHFAIYSGRFDGWASVTNQNFTNKTSIISDKKIILPIETQPIVKNYLHHAVPLSIIGATDNDRVSRIVLSEYIDVIYKPESIWFDYHNDLFEHWHCINCQIIKRELLEINNITPVSYIINALKLGYYSDIWLDAFYIPGKSWYKKSHHIHGILIYGYDEVEQSFYCLSYDDKQQFSVMRIDQSDINAATSNLYFTQIRLLKNNPDVTVPYDIVRLYKKLKDYIHGICSEDISRFNGASHDQSLQIYACQQITNDIIGRYKKNKNIPLTLLYSYNEHKKIMFWRIKYICERENIVLEHLESIMITANECIEKIINLSIKCNMKFTEKTISEIYNMMRWLNNYEKQNIEELLSNLEKKYAWIRTR